MLGLLKKEFYYCKWYLLVFLILYLFISFILLSTSVFPSINTAEGIEEFSSSFYLTMTFIIYFFATMPVSVLSTSFALDERSNFDKFILASGVKRNTVISSKYIFTILSSIVPFTIFTIITIICFTNQNVNLVWEPLFIVSVIICYLGITIFVTTLNILLMSKFGQTKQAVIMTILYIIFIFGIAMYLFCVLYLYEEAYKSILVSVIPAFVLIVLSVVFVFLTYQGYRKKEF